MLYILYANVLNTILLKICIHSHLRPESYSQNVKTLKR